MKVLLLLTVLSALLPTLSAGADATGRPWDVLIVDNDPKGTNVRDAPSGTVIATIPVRRDGAPRLVKIIGQAEGWFGVVVDGRSGWVHGSVLGTCASGTEDGAPALSRSPRNDSPSGVTVPSGAPLHLLGMHERWLHVRYLDAHGTRHDGWLPEQAVAQSENEQAQCARTWRPRKMRSRGPAAPTTRPSGPRTTADVGSPAVWERPSSLAVPLCPSTWPSRRKKACPM